MSRRNFTFPSPKVREIASTDATKQFHNELFPQGDVLVRLVRENVGNAYVVVYDQGGEILSAMLFDDHGTYFNVELLLANRLFNPQNAGTKLILLLEDLGKELHYDHIELWSLANKVDYYLSLGYTNTGLAETGRYGKMFRMVKSLR